MRKSRATKENAQDVEKEESTVRARARAHALMSSLSLSIHDRLLLFLIFIRGTRARRYRDRERSMRSRLLRRVLHDGSRFATQSRKRSDYGEGEEGGGTAGGTEREESPRSTITSAPRLLTIVFRGCFPFFFYCLSAPRTISPARKRKRRRRYSLSLLRAATFNSRVVNDITPSREASRETLDGV